MPDRWEIERKDVSPRHLWRGLIDILSDSETEAPELIGAILQVVWGIWLLLPGAPYHPTFWVLSSSFPPQLLGIGMLVVGIEQIWAVASGKLRWRKIGVLYSFFLWVFTTWILASKDPVSLACPTAGVLAGAAAYGGFRLSKEINHYRANAQSSHA